MTDDIQAIPPEPKAEVPVYTPLPPATAPAKSKKTLWIIAGISAAVICLCSVLCLVLVATGAYRVMVERPPVESLIDTFMTEMAARDIDSAYNHFTPHILSKFPQSDLKKLVEGNNFVLFEGYKSINIQNFNLSLAANTNPDMPRGTIAKVDGYVSYEGGFTGSFDAVLEKVDGQWYLYNINITVPPDKFKP